MDNRPRLESALHYEPLTSLRLEDAVQRTLATRDYRGAPKFYARGPCVVLVTDREALDAVARFTRPTDVDSAHLPSIIQGRLDEANLIPKGSWRVVVYLD